MRQPILHQSTLRNLIKKDQTRVKNNYRQPNKGDGYEMVLTDTNYNHFGFLKGWWRDDHNENADDDDDDDEKDAGAAAGGVYCWWWSWW